MVKLLYNFEDALAQHQFFIQQRIDGYKALGYLLFLGDDNDEFFTKGTDEEYLRADNSDDDFAVGWLSNFKTCSPRLAIRTLFGPRPAKPLRK